MLITQSGNHVPDRTYGWVTHVGPVCSRRSSIKVSPYALSFLDHTWRSQGLEYLTGVEYSTVYQRRALVYESFKRLTLKGKR